MKNNQPEQSITKTTTTNNPKFLNQNHARNKHNKQLRKNEMFLNIRVSPTATSSEPTANTLFIKTQYNRKRQNNILHIEITYSNHKKKKYSLFLDTMKHARKHI